MDIQDLKDAEAARQRLEAPLRQAQKMEALGTLAGGVAHDFNNILGTIIGNVELAREDLVPEHPAQESLAEVEKASARGPRARPADPHLRAAAARRAARHRRCATCARNRSGCCARRCRPGSKWSPGSGRDVPNVLADRIAHPPGGDEPVHQRVAGDSGGVGRITVSLATVRSPPRPGHWPGSSPGRYACLTVADTGAASIPRSSDRIFDPFFTTKATGEGTGPGPVGGRRHRQEPRRRDHGRGMPGHGAIFHAYFRGRRSRGVPRADRAAAAAGRGRGQRVLYLDDEAPLVHLTSRLLARRGYEVEGFTRAGRER
jgi:hypothetical protein